MPTVPLTVSSDTENSAELSEGAKLSPVTTEDKLRDTDSPPPSVMVMTTQGDTCKSPFPSRISLASVTSPVSLWIANVAGLAESEIE